MYAGDINVAVAANVSYAIVDIKKEFNKLYPDTNVRIILGSSGKLTAQIKNGAPFHIFMSANMRYPETLFRDKIALYNPKIYAEGRLALISTKKQDFSQGINLVLSDKIGKIAVANPKTAPYGKASYEALKNAKLLKRVQKKFVFAESISQTLSYTIAATDLGFIAKSSLYSPKMKRFKKGENWAEVESSLYTPIKQGIVILKYGENSVESRNFYEFILSDKAKRIFSNYGYKTL